MRGLADLMTDSVHPTHTWIEKADGKKEQVNLDEQDLENLEHSDPEMREQALEDLAGDFLNMEVSFCYAAMPGQSSKDRSKNIHLLIEFFIGAFDWLEIPLPVWVQIERIIGTARIRAQIMSEPPFIRNVTFSLMGVPNVSILSLIHISEPTRRTERSRMPSSA